MCRFLSVCCLLIGCAVISGCVATIHDPDRVWERERWIAILPDDIRVSQYEALAFDCGGHSSDVCLAPAGLRRSLDWLVLDVVVCSGDVQSARAAVLSIHAAWRAEEIEQFVLLEPKPQIRPLRPATVENMMVLPEDPVLRPLSEGRCGMRWVTTIPVGHVTDWQPGRYCARLLPHPFVSRRAALADLESCDEVP
jgi:hypothetical protein